MQLVESEILEIWDYILSALNLWYLSIFRKYSEITNNGSLISSWSF